MLDINQLRATERECAVSYPTALWTAVDELQVITSTPEFLKKIGEVRSATPHDVYEARDLGLDHALIPFFCEPQPEHIDYYCCGCAGPEVSLFAVHTVIEDWPSFGGVRGMDSAVLPISLTGLAQTRVPISDHTFVDPLPSVGSYFTSRKAFQPR